MPKSQNFARRRRLAAENAAEVPPAEPTAAPPIDEPSPMGANPFANWPKAALEDVLANLGKYADDKGVLDSIQLLAEEIRKRPEDPVEQPAAKSASFVHNEDTMDPLEGYIKEITEAHAEVEDPPVDDLPATVLPSKFAAEMTAGKAAKLGAATAEKLKTLFLEAKPITGANESRPVRAAVDMIYAAYQKMGEAVEILTKQDIQEKEEAEAQEAMMAKPKKSAAGASKKDKEFDDKFDIDADCIYCDKPLTPDDSWTEVTPDRFAHESCREKEKAKGTKFAARKRAEVANETAKTEDAEEEEDSRKTSSRGRSLLANLVTAPPAKTAARATRKDRAEFVRLLTEHAPKAQSKEVNEHTVASIAEDLMRYGSSYSRIQEFKGSPETMDPKYEAKEEEIRSKVQGLCTQLGVAPIFGTDHRACTIKINCPDRFTNDHDRQGICVPTA